MRQIDTDPITGFLVPEMEPAFLTKRQTGNNRIFAQHILVIGMPCNAVAPVAILVQQNRVERRIGFFFDQFTKWHDNFRKW